MQFLCTVAGNKAASDRAQLRHFAAAVLCGVGAAHVKTAAGRRDSLLSRCSVFQRAWSCSCVMALHAEVAFPIFCAARRCVFWNMTEWRYNLSENILTRFIKIGRMDI